MTCTDTHDCSCPACQEARRYANATYCPMCCTYTIDGVEVEAPEWADVRHEVCERCKELEQVENKLHSTPDWWNDLYTDANGNCYSDAEGGL